MPKRIDPSSVAFAGFSALYPIIAISTMRIFGVGAALAIVVIVVAARLLLPFFRGTPVAISFALVPVLVAMAGVAAFDQQLSVRLYPVFMNAAMLSVFLLTLWKPPSMVEQFARAVEPDLPESGVRYTRNVTIVWSCFFAVNCAIALWSALRPGWTAWLIYNGFIAYLAAGMLFAGEYLVRQRVRARQ